MNSEAFAFWYRFPKQTNRKQAPCFTPGVRDLLPSQDGRAARQAPGFTPGVHDLLPSQDGRTAQQAPGFTPGVHDRSDLPPLG